VHEGKLSDTIAVNTGVSLGSIFLMVMDDVMNKIILGEKRKELDWSISQQVDDVDFADDIYMLSHTCNKIYI
jgi:hypothetical protein